MAQAQPTAKIKDLQHYPFVLIPRAFLDRKPSVNAIAAYLGIKCFVSSKTGKSGFASVPTMARLVSLSVRSFQRATAELTKIGVLRVRRRRQKDARSLPNVYELLDLDSANNERRI